jgi:nicotinamide mononucleotide transporter
MSPIEITATVFGLVCVWFTIKQNIWCWPTGLVQVILYIYVFYMAKLYSDSILQAIYIPMQIYGWYYWLYGDKSKAPPVVTTEPTRMKVLWMTVILVGATIWGYIMKTYTNAACPYPDAFIVVTSLVAQWLMSKKKLESWVLWVIVDMVAVGVYFYKSLYFTTGLYAVYIGMATAGLLAWRRDYVGRINAR